jgi:4'-phosphopantetheinyl transferase
MLWPFRLSETAWEIAPGAENSGFWAGIRCGQVMFLSAAPGPRAGFVTDCGTHMHPRLEIAPEEIHLWFAFDDEIADERLLASYRDLLSDEEKKRELRFHFAKDRRRYRVTRALVRTVLARYAAIDPEDWIFSVGPNGRPEIANAEVAHERLSFNISHTPGLIVLGVARRRELGVDVEDFLARDASIDIADQFFSPAEVAALASVPRHQQQYRFFEYWTFKEAYIKATGLGLSLPLDQFSFGYPGNGAVEMVIHSGLSDRSSRWQFWQFRPGPQYLLAVCAERIGNRPSTVTARRIVPAAAEEMLNLLPTRNSI